MKTIRRWFSYNPELRASRNRATKGIVALAMMLLLILPPRHVNAEILTAITITSTVLSTLISLGDTEADPHMEMTAQTRQMLKYLHERLNGYDQAIKGILKRLDALPKEIRREIDDAFVNERIVNVRTLMGLILDDVKILKKLRTEEQIRGTSKLTPIADAALRLHDLQIAVGNLLQANEDLIVFDLIAAKYVEQALIAMQGGIEADIDWSVRWKRYHNRLERIVESRYEEKSLWSLQNGAKEKAEEMLQHWKENEIPLLLKSHLASCHLHFRNIERAPELEQKGVSFSRRIEDLDYECKARAILELTKPTQTTHNEITNKLNSGMYLMRQFDTLLEF